MRADIADWGQLLGGAVPPSSGAKQPMALPSGGGGGSLGKAKAQRSYDDARNIISQGDAWSKIFTTLGKTIKSWDTKVDAMMLDRLETAVSGLGTDILFKAPEFIAESSEEALRPEKAKALAYEKVKQLVDTWQKSTEATDIFQNETTKEIWEKVGRESTINGIVANIAPIVRDELNSRMKIHEAQHLEKIADASISLTHSLVHNNLSEQERIVVASRTGTAAGQENIETNKEWVKSTLDNYKLYLKATGISDQELKHRMTLAKQHSEIVGLHAVMELSVETRKQYISGILKPKMPLMTSWKTRWPNIPYPILSQAFSKHHNEGLDLLEKEQRDWGFASAGWIAQGPLTALEEAIRVKSPSEWKNHDDMHYRNLSYLSGSNYQTVRNSWKSAHTTRINAGSKATKEQKDALRLDIKNWLQKSSSSDSQLQKDAVENNPLENPAHVEAIAAMTPTERQALHYKGQYIRNTSTITNKITELDGPSLSEIEQELSAFNPDSTKFQKKHKGDKLDLEFLTGVYSNYTKHLDSIKTDLKTKPVATVTSLIGKHLVQDDVVNSETIADKYKKLTGTELTTFLKGDEIDNRTAIVNQHAKSGDQAMLMDYMTKADKEIIDTEFSDPAFRDKYERWLFSESGIFTPLMNYLYTIQDAPNTSSLQQKVIQAIQIQAQKPEEKDVIKNLVDDSGEPIEFNGQKGPAAVDAMVQHIGHLGPDIKHHPLVQFMFDVTGKQETVLERILKAQTHLSGSDLAAASDTLTDAPLVEYLDRELGDLRVGPLTAVTDPVTRAAIIKEVAAFTKAVLLDPNYDGRDIKHVIYEGYSAYFHNTHVVPQATKNSVLIQKSNLPDIYSYTDKELTVAVQDRINEAIQSGKFDLSDKEQLIRAGYSPDAIDRIQNVWHTLLAYGDTYHQMFGFDTGKDGQQYLFMLSVDRAGSKHKIFLRHIDPATKKSVPYTIHDRDIGQAAIDRKSYNFLATQQGMGDGIKYPLTKEMIQDKLSGGESILTRLTRDDGDPSSIEALNTEADILKRIYLRDESAPKSFETKEELLAYLSSIKSELKPIDTISNLSKIMQFFGRSSLESEELKQSRIENRGSPSLTRPVEFLEGSTKLSINDIFKSLLEKPTITKEELFTPLDER